MSDMVQINNERDNVTIYLDSVSSVVWDNSINKTLEVIYLKQVGKIYLLCLEATDNEFFNSIDIKTPINMGLLIDTQEAEKLINLGVQIEK